MKVDHFAMQAILRNTLWQTPLQKGVFLMEWRDWVDLYNYASRQGVFSIIWDSIEGNKAPIPMEISVPWKARVEEIEKGNSIQNAIIDAQKRKWADENVEAVLMKGQSLAVNYPVPSHRLCGDIDWYFPTKHDWTMAKAIAEVATGAPLERDSDGDLHYIWHGVLIEHHRHWHHMSSASATKYLDSLLEPDKNIVQMLMLNTHILRHAMVFGVGLRQLCDLALLYKACAGKVDGEKYREHLRELHLLKWTDLLHSFLVGYLGMPEEYLPYKSRKVGYKSLLGIVERCGDLGSGARKLPGFLKAAFVFIPLCPAEFFARSGSLVKGRIGRL